MVSTNVPIQRPLKFRVGGKTDVRTQFAALCFRESGDDTEVCLITTRDTGRWLLPKGWPMNDSTPAEAAATEAYEEAGIRGIAIDRCLGLYSDTKFIGDDALPVLVLVYPVKVTKVLKDWPEKHQRKRLWMPLRKAAKKVDEKGLSVIIKSFDPSMLD